jgi:hypothetical protein
MKQETLVAFKNKEFESVKKVHLRNRREKILRIGQIKGGGSGQVRVLSLLT